MLPPLSLPLVTKGRWQAVGLTEGIRASGDRRLTIPQTRCASQLPLHKGASPLRREGWQRLVRLHVIRKHGAGGYKIRPYRPAPGFLVGAAYMAARNQVPIPTRVVPPP